MFRLHEPIFADISRWVMYGYMPGGGAQVVLTTIDEKRIDRAVSTLRRGQYGTHPHTYGRDMDDPDHDKIWAATVAVLKRNGLYGSLTIQEIARWRGFDNTKDNDPERMRMLLHIVDYDLFRSFAPPYGQPSAQA